jgi:hypothetical protein
MRHMYYFLKYGRTVQDFDISLSGVKVRLLTLTSGKKWVVVKYFE